MRLLKFIERRKRPGKGHFLFRGGWSSHSVDMRPVRRCKKKKKRLNVFALYTYTTTHTDI